MQPSHKLFYISADENVRTEGNNKVNRDQAGHWAHGPTTNCAFDRQASHALKSANYFEMAFQIPRKPVGRNGLPNGGSNPTQESLPPSRQPDDHEGRHSQSLRRSISARASEVPHYPISTEEIRIAVMGMTGSGKSTFIKRVTGREDIQVGHSLNSETSECEAYSFQAHSLSFTLIDTPGFDDSELSEAAVLSKLALYMALNYRSGALLDAILYLHPIHEPRFEGSARNNLAMFQSLCGEDFYSNVVLATSFWSEVSETDGATRLAQLEEEFWGDMLQKGARTVRLPDEPEKCQALLLELARAGNAQKSLLIQRQMVDEGRTVDETDAAVSTPWLRERHAIIEQHQREVQELKQEQEDLLQHQEEEETEELTRLATEIKERQIRDDEEVARTLNALFLREEALEQKRREREVEERLGAQRRTRFIEDRERVETDRNSRRILRDEIMDIISGPSLPGSPRANLMQRFWDLGVPICDVCQHRCAVQLSYCKLFSQPPVDDQPAIRENVSVNMGPQNRDLVLPVG